VKIEYDESKRQWTLEERGLDFLDAPKIFDAVEFELIDDRFEYGEVRIISFGQLDDRPVAVVWTAKGRNRRRIISMRYAHDREIKARRKAMD